MHLRQSTSYTFRHGPFVDETDGKTAETGLTISQADVRLSKAGGDFAQKNESSASSHDEIGFYIVVLDATDTNTCGELLVAVHESGALPVFKTFQVVEETIYDSMFASSATLDTKLDAIDTVVDSILTKLPNIPTKGVAIDDFPFFLVDNTDHVTPKTGLTSITAQRSIDGASFASCSNSPTEVGSGVYKIKLSSGDLNGDTITLRFSKSGADDRVIVMVTQAA